MIEVTYKNTKLFKKLKHYLSEDEQIWCKENMKMSQEKLGNMMGWNKSKCYNVLRGKTSLTELEWKKIKEFIKYELS